MDKDISIWNVGFGVMSMGDADNRNRICERHLWNSFMPTIKHSCEEDGKAEPRIFAMALAAVDEQVREDWS